MLAHRIVISLATTNTAGLETTMANAPRILLPPENNVLLAMLSNRSAADARDVLTPVELRFGDVLHEAYEPQEYVYSRASVVDLPSCLLGSGSTAEMMRSGRAGMVGLADSVGRRPVSVGPLGRPLPQAYRMPAKKLRA